MKATDRLEAVSRPSRGFEKPVQVFIVEVGVLIASGCFHEDGGRLEQHFPAWAAWDD